jgi:hypothetical protein
MLQLPLGQLVLLTIQATILFTLIVRIWSAGLYVLYPFFFSYLVADLLQTLIGSAMPYNGHAYARFWVASEGIIDCCYALIVVELYRIVFRELPGIASVSRRYITVTVAIAIVASLFLQRLAETPANYLSVFFVIECAVVFSLLIFILLVSAFLAYYPVSLHRNVVVYSIGYAVYFLTKAAALFIRTLGYYVAPQISTALLVVSSVCLLFWTLGLNRRGEERTVVIGHQWNRDDEARLLSKLKAINASLVGVGKQ